MRIRWAVTTAHEECDVVVEATAGASLAQIRPAMAAAVGVPLETAWWSGRRLLPDSAKLGGPGLRAGDTVCLGTPPAAEPDPSPLHLAVVGGPGAGGVLPLGRGVHLIGRADLCDLRLPDAEVSRRHAAVTVTTAGVSVRDLDSRNGTTTAGVAIDRDGGDLEPDQAVRLGHSTVVLRAGLAVPTAVRPTDDGRVLVLRPADDRRPTPAPTLTAPPATAERPRPRTAWVAALLPAIAAVGLAWLLHTWQFLAFAALSPLTLLGTAAGDRWSWRAGRRRLATEQARATSEYAERRERALLDEGRARADAHPDAPRCLVAATGPCAPLWQRNPHERGALQVRLGTASRPSWTRTLAADGGTGPAGTIPDAPVCADLARGPLGIAGPREHAQAVARAVLTQLAVAHPPGAVEFVVLVPDGHTGAGWDWLRWLPHRVRHADDPASRHRILAELLARADAVAPRWGADRPAAPTPWTVLVVDRPGSWADHPALAELLQNGSAAGVHAVCLDLHPQALPAACAATAVTRGPTHALLGLQGTGWDTADGEPDALGPVVADQVAEPWCDRLARALAPLDDGTRGGGLPREVRLLDLLGRPSDDDVVAGWSATAGPGATAALRAVVGVDGQEPVALDLDTDGPHALVAGTTGAGKSEFLRTWVTALASAHPPDDVGFLLVDYKGGAAFGACVRLPHTIGLVTDLDPHLTSRVLRSLQAEIRRRERLFAAVGASDLPAYRRQGGTESLPRLVVVVDEFATLAADLPDFVPGLVDVAQRGRSLGVHLVLATQRPGHAVSPAIRANTSLRVALRVTDAGESNEIAGTPDAATLDPSCPGRAVVRSARGVVRVQFAHAAARLSVDGDAVRVQRVGPWDAPAAPACGPDERTELDDVVDLLEKAWARRFADGATAPLPTWVPPLPDDLRVDDLVPVSAGAVGGSLRLAWGLRDRPDEQRQVTEHLDLAVGGTTLLVGAARTGRTEALRVVAHAAADHGVPTVVVDTGGLDSVATLPGTVARVAADDADTVMRLVGRLEQEFAARREASTRPPLVVLVDDWTTVAHALDEVDGGRGTDRWLALWRAAGGLGVTVVVTGDRGALAARTSSAADRLLLLRPADAADVAAAGLRPRDVPEHLPPGRAVVCPGGDLVQLALAGPPPIGTVPDRTLTDLRLRPLPRRYTLRGPGPGSRRLRLGVGGDAARPVEVDPWAAGGRWLVAGPPRSGRSSTLAVLAAEAAEAGHEVVWWARPHSPLAALASTRGWVALRPDVPELPATGTGRRLVLLDDVDDLADTAASEAVAAALRAAAPLAPAVVCAGRPDELLSSYRGVVAEVRRARRGLLLQPGPGDGELVGVRTGRVVASAPPGRGLLVADGVWVDGAPAAVGPISVQVAAAPAEQGAP